MSFRTYQDFSQLPPTFFPRVWTINNYLTLFSKNVPLMSFYLNSVVIAAITVPAVVLMSSLAGYGFARLRFPGRDTIFWIMISTLFLPLGLPRLFTIFELTWKMGLMDTIWALILPYLSMGLVVYIFIMRNIFLEIPQELQDAARVDGCSPLGVFRTIMLPLAAPGLVMVAVLYFLAVWGEFLLAATLTYAKGMTLPVALVVATSETQGDTVLTTLATAYILAMIPPLLIYLTLNRYFQAGLARGALKF
ncbi:MAG: carbohydrate ABC transporter permease [Anaerolineae bacterium]|nr:carbohydrate ABC transporter permease [Anaerolineae bacterium]